MVAVLVTKTNSTIQRPTSAAAYVSSIAGSPRASFLIRRRAILLYLARAKRLFGPGVRLPEARKENKCEQVNEHEDGEKMPVEGFEKHQQIAGDDQEE